MTSETKPQPTGRKMSVVDEILTQTYEDFKQATARPKRPLATKIAYALGAVCIVLLGGVGLLASQVSAVEQERDTLAVRLHAEQAARTKAEQAIKDAEFRLANANLETRVRRDIVDERMAVQQTRAVQLDQEAEAVRLAKLAEADCVTPRSVITAAGL
jgi:hypothetical protein